MSTYLFEEEIDIPATSGHRNLLEHVSSRVALNLAKNETPIRFVMTSSDVTRYRCEIGTMADSERKPTSSIFDFKQRHSEDTSSFNAVLLVPTGIGA